jgi:hypothetical protein
MMLASAVVRTRAGGVDEARRASVDGASVSGTAVAWSDGDAATAELTVSRAEAEAAAVAPAQRAEPAPGNWELACELKDGSSLVFDRRSLRDFGAVTLFRWAAASQEEPRVDESIYTAVVNCREKTIEAAWPGKRSETRAGTCGRRLVDAVCSLAGGAPAPSRGRRPGPAPGRGSPDESSPRR